MHTGPRLLPIHRNVLCHSCVQGGNRKSAGWEVFNEHALNWRKSLLSMLYEPKDTDDHWSFWHLCPVSSFHKSERWHFLQMWYLVILNRSMVNQNRSPHRKLCVISATWHPLFSTDHHCFLVYAPNMHRRDKYSVTVFQPLSGYAMSLKWNSTEQVCLNPKSC